MENDRGLTIWLCFGGYGGFYVKLKGQFRICLGWVSLQVLPFDAEGALKNMIRWKEDHPAENKAEQAGKEQGNA